MDATTLNALIDCAQVLAVAVIGGLFARDNRKRKQRLADAAEESRLNMKLLSAGLCLSVETARALKRGTVNGEMDDALDDAEDAKKEYYNFVNSVASKQIAG